jgi:hypothetical protein
LTIECQCICRAFFAQGQQRKRVEVVEGGHRPAMSLVGRESRQECGYKWSVETPDHGFRCQVGGHDHGGKVWEGDQGEKSQDDQPLLRKVKEQSRDDQPLSWKVKKQSWDDQLPSRKVKIQSGNDKPLSWKVKNKSWNDQPPSRKVKNQSWNDKPLS